MCLKAYTAGAVVAAICGILGYFDVAGLGGEVFAHAGRASGTFKDPNVLGSYLVLPIVWLAQNFTLGRRAQRALHLGAADRRLSRHVSDLLARLLWRDGHRFRADDRLGLSPRRTRSEDEAAHRIRRARGAGDDRRLSSPLLLSIPETRELFELRTAATQDYDAGETGRFGNQLRSIPMLLDRFMGFGPLRFRLVFNLEPHNSYIGAFANNGWIGGFLFFLLVGVTAWIGLLMMFSPSPAQRQAQVDRSHAPRALSAGLSDRHRPLALRILHARRRLGAGGAARTRSRAGRAALNRPSPPAAPASSPPPEASGRRAIASAR